MSTPVILADRFPSSTCDTPTSTCHVIIARAELRDRPHTGLIRRKIGPTVTPGKIQAEIASRCHPRFMAHSAAYHRTARKRSRAVPDNTQRSPAVDVVNGG
jgi:hypothetical protein